MGGGEDGVGGEVEFGEDEGLEGLACCVALEVVFAFDELAEGDGGLFGFADVAYGS